MIRVVKTADGSNSLYREDLEEQYHSVHGALQESMHVFIEAGLQHMADNPLRILEVGMGTGLNVILTLLHRSNRSIHYQTLETKALNKDLVEGLSYTELLEDERVAPWLDSIHTAEWNTSFALDEDFTFQKRMEALQMAKLEDESIDLIYYDAFGYRAQPEMWETELFVKLAKCMCPGGSLVTYAAKGVIRRSMLAAGLEVERLKGPKGKKHMLRATKPKG